MQKKKSLLNYLHRPVLDPLIVITVVVVQGTATFLFTNNLSQGLRKKLMIGNLQYACLTDTLKMEVIKSTVNKDPSPSLNIIPNMLTC